jgi:hypothetical protein
MQLQLCYKINHKFHVVSGLFFPVKFIAQNGEKKKSLYVLTAIPARR